MSTEEANDYIGRFEGKTRGCYAAPVRARGVSMRKVALIVAVTGVMLFAGFLGWSAEATTLTGPATLLAVTHSYSRFKMLPVVVQALIVRPDFIGSAGRVAADVRLALITTPIIVPTPVAGGGASRPSDRSRRSR